MKQPKHHAKDIILQSLREAYFKRAKLKHSDETEAQLDILEDAIRERIKQLDSGLQP